VSLFDWLAVELHTSFSLENLRFVFFGARCRALIVFAVFRTFMGSLVIVSARIFCFVCGWLELKRLLRLSKVIRSLRFHP